MAPVKITSGAALLAGRYQLGPLLGRGGMAEVYEGFDDRLARSVAVKMLRPDMAAQPDVRRRFEAEAQAAARLSHPNAVAVFDTGEDDGVPFIVMERLPGETLADRIQGGPLDPDWLRRLAGDVLGALGAAHAAGLVHRDVKPGNILIAADGCAKVADFGIAKSLEEAGAADLTGVGQLIGTPAYLAPERLEGHAASPQSDLYAVGVVLYEALAGVKPFSGTTPLVVAHAVSRGEYTPLVELQADVPDDLRAAVERAMDRDPDQRFQTAGDMAAAIGRGGSASTGESGSPTLAALADPTEAIPVAVPAAPTTVIDPAGAVGQDASWPARKGWGRVAGPLAALLGTNNSPPSSHRRRPVAVIVVIASLLLVGLALAAGRGTGGASDRAGLADRLRAVADQLGPEDGTSAAGVADDLEEVAEAVEAGGGANAANTLLARVAGLKAPDELAGPAGAEVNAALLQVPGAALPAPAPATTAVTTPDTTPPPAASSGEDHSTGEDRDDDKGTAGKGKGRGKG